MTKEQILDLMKWLVLESKNHSKEIQTDPKRKQDWVSKQQYLEQSIKSLNSCDADWLGDEYSKFFSKELKPHIDKLDSLLSKNK